MTFSADQFLQDHWQKSPVVLRNFYPDFDDPLDEHDLAGLAQEDDVDSRIIREVNGNWHLDQGPFDDFSEPCQGHWTLLVQDVDKYIAEVDGLTEAFRFIPNWRVDDVMVSFAVAGAGVGSHVDQYDVFLVQGKGKRRWRVGPPGNYQEVFPHPSLRQLSSFPTHFEVELQPGDVLYIPPGWPHEGVTIKDSLTYSVGFRAPTTADITQCLTDALDSCQLPVTRYTDPTLARAVHPASVPLHTLTVLKEQLIDAIHSEAFDEALLRLLSDQHLPVDVPDELLTVDTLRQHLDAGTSFGLAAGCRPLFCDEDSASEFSFYVNGERFAVSRQYDCVFKELLDGALLDLAMYQRIKSFAELEILTTLINKRYWVLWDHDD
ncbi:cupin domain-containing protein [Alteromonas sp. ASW11-19]|uniref:Cupin domain-containing protein n=1 Tax=Alteromonas salexigens TaxID=2982530 RepID=A0ABT2VM55_9ALTE|nr:cupin domain-containing protein [Alteromonas salexigens]MCU7554395.1 cupin domain-containing protein [Alteromonas salexigens]